VRPSSSNRDRGSALIEAVVVGSVVFIAVLAAVAAAIDVAVVGGHAQAAAHNAAVHAARHAGPAAAVPISGPHSRVERIGDDISVIVTPMLVVPHLDGLRRVGILATAVVPIAPFRSDRG
jgi:hypothetical protein